MPSEIVSAMRQLERVTAERQRLNSLYEVRGQVWRTAGQLERSVTDWLHSGVPSGVTLEDCEGDPVNELLKKRESIKDAVERLRSANGRKHWRSGVAEMGILHHDLVKCRNVFIFL